MSFKKLTLSYDDFSDEENGLVPYLASAVMMLIRKNDMESLQALVNDIAEVAEQLLDLNDEIIKRKEDYDQLQNRIAALKEDMRKKEEAQAALMEEMKNLIGDADEEFSDTMEPAGAIDMSAMAESSMGELDPLSELDFALGGTGDDALSGLDDLTVENVMTNQNVPEALRKAGIVFGDEIDKLAAAHEEEMEELEDDDVYADFDLQIEDVDQGYAPVPDDGEGDSGFDGEDLFGDMDADGGAGDDDDFDTYDDGYDDMDLFVDVEDDGGSGSGGSGSSRIDDDFIDAGGLDSVDDIFSPGGMADTPVSSPGADDGITSGIVDLDMFD